MKKTYKLSVQLAALALFLMSNPARPEAPTQKEDPKKALQEMRLIKEAAKNDRQAAILKLEAKIAPLLEYSIEELQLAVTIKVITKYGGSKVVADDDEHTFLGEIADELSANSIFNDFGTHGNKYASASIHNDYGRFGGQYSAHSPFNKYSSTPPLIVRNGRAIGRLTVNKYVAGAVDPNWLSSHFKY